ncbi:MAG: hypothetical protein IJM59_11095, partial [Proteobacteria bacterium]|nr:hypothetical protein [Pseudomonadota bacterium]
KEIKVAQQGTDTDGDTIIDALECHPEDTELGFTEPNEPCVDSDGDTIPDYKDTDSDNDTIPDSIEANNDGGKYEPEDADYDGLPNYIDTDSDDNGILDKDECGGAKENGLFKDCKDTDGDKVPDYLDYDNDGDGFSDVDEIKGLITNNQHEKDGHFSGYCGGKNALGSASKPVDCDGDTVPDYMDTDSDNDGLTDAQEGMLRLASNGFLARYNSDTDGDGISDKIEGLTDDSDGDGIPNFLEVDSDNDGLSDKDEYALESQEPCKSAGIKPRLSADADKDGFKDAAEYAVALETQKSGYTGTKYTPAQMICNKAIGVKNVYEFYFELPDNKTDNDVLLFTPKVSKLDVVFNMDTTGSMGGEVTNLKNKIRNYLIPEIRKRVDDSGFGVTRFDDFPVNGYGSGADVPFIVYGEISKDATTVTNAANQLATHNGNDGPESGYESLWQIVRGDDHNYPQSGWRSSASGSWTYQSYCNPKSGWGCVGFRASTLPVVVHITDATSHDQNTKPYDTTYVTNPHYSPAVHSAYQSKGARVLSIYRSSSQQSQLVNTSQVTNAIVPACAFKKADGSWKCGENKCCVIGTGTSGVATISGTHNCVLSYAIPNATQMSDTVVDGLDALVKYGTYSVKTKLRGNAIGNGKNTTCFIEKIEAKGYIAPPAEPEKSCNPTATPAKLGESYNSGFTNFATGTSSVNKKGAQLTFTVYAKNDGCYKQDKQTHVFEAYIDVYDPTTNLLFDTQKVSIIVPALIDSNIGESGD